MTERNGAAQLETNDNLHQALAALRERVAEFRALFNSIDQGFCLVEMRFDDSRRAVDYRFVEVNAVFEQQTGLRNAVVARQTRAMGRMLDDLLDVSRVTFGRLTLRKQHVTLGSVLEAALETSRPSI
jgi:PAS domain-containing protein